ncbi:MAG TPA: hypothetical protein VLA19_29785 [Herpetosiphonaceae bacterium]|nr:hypothetical protein [Herpetosiphonaceae bacterium]
MAHDIVHDEMLELADALVRALSYLDMDHGVRGAMPATWEQAARLLKSAQPADQRLGYVLLLTTILETPNAAYTLVERLRDGLRGTEAQRWAA